MSTKTKKPIQVACPTCQKLTLYSAENRYRPFCSERCKMIDLGEWANEGYKIPDKTPTNQFDDYD